MKIALFGKMRSGKNTVADILTHEYGFRQFAFGDGIAKIIREYFPQEWAKGKPRKHYQHIGQALRGLNQDVWIDYLFKNVGVQEVFNKGLNTNREISGREEIPFNIVVTDCRQLNEAERLRAEGYLIVRVVCDEEIRVQRIKEKGDSFTEEQLNHETELQVDLIEPDVEITNNGTLSGLKYQVKCLMSDIERGAFNGK